nr:neurofilament heavy polypeptide-like [Tanacetum cinerariifolium]
MILDVDLKCRCCYKKVKKLLCKVPQVRDQVFDVDKNKVTIKEFKTVNWDRERKPLVNVNVVAPDGYESVCGVGPSVPSKKQCVRESSSVPCRTQESHVAANVSPVCTLFEFCTMSR